MFQKPSSIDVVQLAIYASYLPRNYVQLKCVLPGKGGGGGGGFLIRRQWGGTTG